MISELLIKTFIPVSRIFDNEDDNFIFSEAEFKEFEPRFKFKPRLKFCWFHLNLYSIFQDLSRRSIKTVFGGFETRLKFIKLGL